MKECIVKVLVPCEEGRLKEVSENESLRLATMMAENILAGIGEEDITIPFVAGQEIKEVSEGTKKIIVQGYFHNGHEKSLEPALKKLSSDYGVEIDNQPNNEDPNAGCMTFIAGEKGWTSEMVQALNKYLKCGYPLAFIGEA